MRVFASFVCVCVCVCVCVGVCVDQEMQNDLDRETCSLQELEAQKQDAQDRLEEMDQQKAKLEDMLNDVRQKCQEESQMVRLAEWLNGCCYRLILQHCDVSSSFWSFGKNKNFTQG